jgi:hypothetical protein
MSDMITFVSYTDYGCLPRIYVNQVQVFEVIANREIGPYLGYSYVVANRVVAHQGLRPSLGTPDLAASGIIATGTDLPFYDDHPDPEFGEKPLVRPLVLTPVLKMKLRAAVSVLPTKFARVMVRDCRAVGERSEFAVSLWAAILGSDNEAVCRTEELLNLSDDCARDPAIGGT